jgi:hypothetical protein
VRLIDFIILDDVSASDYKSLLFSTKKTAEIWCIKNGWTLSWCSFWKRMNTHFFFVFYLMADILERNLQFAFFFIKTYLAQHGFCLGQSRTGIKRPLRPSIRKSSKGPQNFSKRPLFWHFVWEIVKAPMTNVALFLWPVRPCH